MLLRGDDVLVRIGVSLVKLSAVQSKNIDTQDLILLMRYLYPQSG